MNEQIPEDIKAFWEEFDRVFDTLYDDLVAITSQQDREKKQTWRRAFCRALFALIEGHTYLLKKYVLVFWWGIIAGGETELRLRDQRKIKDKDGKEQIVTSYLPFLENVFFAFDTYSWVNGATFVLDKNDDGWKALVAATTLRNRVVHPKSATDLTITDQEMESLQKASQWYFERATRLFEESGEALKRWADAMERNIEMRGYFSAGEDEAQVS